LAQSYPRLTTRNTGLSKTQLDILRRSAKPSTGPSKNDPLEHADDPIWDAVMQSPGHKSPEEISALKAMSKKAATKKAPAKRGCVRQARKRTLH